MSLKLKPTNNHEELRNHIAAEELDAKNYFELVKEQKELIIRLKIVTEYLKKIDKLETIANGEK